ncbi:hypothetical protein KOW79_003091 [Hemibagrus wyckioides]|uniref:Uncharacterized protein n=1 Tax=Hemibagrus wyckioides TaxID=337641 RepID=A0A9D3P2K4_9TELE|nr:hypothetical protein KOW79_003091 [Hemibagrus wyckioides]
MLKLTSPRRYLWCSIQNWTSKVDTRKTGRCFISSLNTSSHGLRAITVPLRNALIIGTSGTWRGCIHRVTDLVGMEECGSNECESTNDGRGQIGDGMPANAGTASRAVPLAVRCQRCVLRTYQRLSRNKDGTVTLDIQEVLIMDKAFNHLMNLCLKKQRVATLRSSEILNLDV